MELRRGLELGALAELLAPAFAASRNGWPVARAGHSYEQARATGERTLLMVRPLGTAVGSLETRAAVEIGGDACR